MPTPEFRWIRYTVERSHLPALRGLTFLAAPELVEAPTVIELPDLTDYPTPIQKAEVLLHGAAEVEHALLVQYLYAAYSLRNERDPEKETDQQRLDQLRQWRGTIVEIAKEEMGHLLSVQNLLLLLGLPLSLEREEMPPRKKLFPFPLNLEPLSRLSLAKYVVAEAPPDAEGIEDIVKLATGAAGQAINHVGVLYALLGLVLTKEGDLDKHSTRGAWYKIVKDIGQLAFKQQIPAFWHLPDTAFHPDSFDQQAKISDDEWPVRNAEILILNAHNRDEALEALSKISTQGEGAGIEDNSHFERFLAAFRGSASPAMPAPPFPGDADWQPARTVPVNPRVPKDGTPISPGDITHPTTLKLARLADLRYALLLGYLEHSLLVRGADRSFLIIQAIYEMSAQIRLLARELVTKPLRPEGSGFAGPPFTPPPLSELHLPPKPEDDRERWGLHQKRLQQAIQLATILGRNTDTDQTTLAEIAKHLTINTH